MHTLSPQHAWKFICGLNDGLRSRFIGNRSLPVSNEEHQGRVAKFFAGNRSNPEAENIADVGSGPFAAIANEKLAQISDDYRQVIDIGCGNCSLLPQILQSGKRYVGIDLSISKPIESENVILIEGAADGNLTIPRMPGSALLVAVNVLCYYQSLEDLGSFLDVNTKMGDAFLVIEPSPSFFWETYFSGIFVYIRSQRRIRDFFASKGWLESRSDRVFLYGFFGFGLFQVSSMTLFTRGR